MRSLLYYQYKTRRTDKCFIDTRRSGLSELSEVSKSHRMVVEQTSYNPSYASICVNTCLAYILKRRIVLKQPLYLFHVHLVHRRTRTFAHTTGLSHSLMNRVALHSILIPTYLHNGNERMGTPLMNSCEHIVLRRKKKPYTTS